MFRKISTAAHDKSKFDKLFLRAGSCEISIWFHRRAMLNSITCFEVWWTINWAWLRGLWNWILHLRKIVNFSFLFVCLGVCFLVYWASLVPIGPLAFFWKMNLCLDKPNVELWNSLNMFTYLFSFFIFVIFIYF